MADPASGDAAFVAAFQQVAVRTPTALVETWEALVAEVGTGYDDEADTYLSEIGVRDTIERVLTDAGLSRFSQLGWVRERVEAADERFRPLLQAQELPALVARPWWEAHPPRCGGPVLVESFRRTYGVEIAIQDGVDHPE